MENKIARHIEVNGVTYDVPTIEGFDLSKLGYGVEYNSIINQYYIENIKASEDLKYNWEKPWGDISKDITFLPNLDWSETPNIGQKFMNFTNLKYVDLMNSSKSTTMLQTFHACYNLISINEMYFNNSTQADYMCYNCQAINHIKLTSVEKVTSFHAAFTGCSALSTLLISGWKNATININSSSKIDTKSIKYIIFHAVNIADGATNRTLTLHATPLATWNDEVANTTPTAEDAEFLGVEGWDRYKKDDGSLYTWGEIASGIKDITIA